MKEIKITSIAWTDDDTCTEWVAQYEVSTSGNVSIVVIYTGYSWLEIVIAEFDDNGLSDRTYFIAVLDDHTAVCRVSSLDDPDQISEQLLIAGLSVMEAVTVAQVLSNIEEEESMAE